MLQGRIAGKDKRQRYSQIPGFVSSLGLFPKFPKDLSGVSGERQATPEDNSWDLKRLQIWNVLGALWLQHSSRQVTGLRQGISPTLDMAKTGRGPQGENAALLPGLRDRVVLPTGLNDLPPQAVPPKGPPVAQTKPDMNFYLEKTSI